MNTTDMSRTISLIVTEKCNLNCIYCYEHNKTNRNMSFNTAKHILDKELTEDKINIPTYIEFFGGEPFCNFEVIKQIYDYVTSFYTGKFRFFATTNGSLIHEEIKDWLIARREFFTIGLSLDGMPFSHNLNRSDSFNKIDIGFFLKHYPNQPVKMTVSVQTLPYFSKNIQYLHSLGFRIECNLAYMIDWGNEQNKIELEKQLNELIDFYIENNNLEKCGMLRFNLGVLEYADRSKANVRKYCGSGTHMKCYDIDGDAYPCQLFAPISAGAKAKKCTEIELQENIAKILLPDECNNCYYQPLCPMCIGSNYISTGNLYRSDFERCSLYKILFAANAKLNALEWAAGFLKLSVNDEQALLRAIIKIQDINKKV